MYAASKCSVVKKDCELGGNCFIDIKQKGIPNSTLRTCNLRKQLYDQTKTITCSVQVIHLLC